ncbi:MAG: acetylornithine deacetylase [Alphaproteobacteria bacterium]|nr:acetylornithine deacetylase [Alphaproteobacteria bacterium]
MPQRRTAREILATLVAFDTTSALSNMALIDWVRAYLAEWGVASDLTFDATGKKANLFATLGPVRPGGVCLSGHTDVVPVAGQPWTSDPFTLVERDGRLYGRGTCDMKGFIACALALVPDVMARPTREPVHLAFSYDEEVGCQGVGRLIDKVVADGRAPRIVIIGEPTEMMVANAHKGCAMCRVDITGKEAHSSAPQAGANAIMAGAQLIIQLQSMQKRWRDGPQRDFRFTPPYPSINVGLIEGGTAFNIIPRRCSFTFDIRSTPALDTAAAIKEFIAYADTAVLPTLRFVSPDAKIEVQTVVDAPPLRPEPEGEAEALALRLAGSNETCVVAFGTEGGLFQKAGMSAIVCGPGSILQAHQPDEFVAPEQLDKCDAFLAKLVDWAR